MKRVSAIEEPPVIAKPEIDVDVLAAIQPEWLNDSFVYVHCHVDNPSSNMLIRIWPTTFLVDAVSSARSKLIHAENITLAPQWTLLPDFKRYNSCSSLNRCQRVANSSIWWRKSVSQEALWYATLCVTKRMSIMST